MSKIAVIYWSGTGNTTAMANALAEGITAQGTEVEVFSVEAFQNDIASYDKIAFGCSAMGDEVLEEVEFEPFFESIEKTLKGKKVALFGSYGWGDGKWMRDWEDRVKKDGASLFDDGLIVCGFPDAQAKELCKSYGEKFAAF